MYFQNAPVPKNQAGNAGGAQGEKEKYKNEPTRLRVGDDNVFREHVTVHRSNTTREDTIIGSNNFLMQHSHVAHNVVLGDFIILAGGALLGGMSGPALADAAAGELPKRVLGRTGVQVTTFTLGTAPAGFTKPHNPKIVADCVNAAIDLGVNFIDTAPAYDVAPPSGAGIRAARGKPSKTSCSTGRTGFMVFHPGPATAPRPT